MTKEKESVSRAVSEGREAVTPKMTILDIIAQYRMTEAVFEQYDEKAGVCLCCEALFDPLEKVAEQYGLDLYQLIKDLESVIKASEA